MRVNVLSYEPAGGWILYDYAARLVEHLQPHVEHASLNFEQLPGFDVTFHVNYAKFREMQVHGLHATLVTHIDTPRKFGLVSSQAQNGVPGLCMSEETARRLNTLTGTDMFFNFAPPAMTAGEHKRLTVMVAGRLYGDKRKNEQWSIDFFKAFRPADLRIRVMGAGWTTALEELQGWGYEVQHEIEFRRELYIDWLRGSDHLLYTGNDEGALSTLDALLFDVVPIVTAQGYHLEQEGQMMTYVTREQLMAIAARLQAQLDQTNALRRRLTDWSGFAKRHADFWSDQIALRRPGAAPAAATSSTPDTPLAEADRVLALPIS